MNYTKILEKALKLIKANIDSFATNPNPNIIKQVVIDSLNKYVLKSNLSSDKKNVLMQDIKQQSKNFVSSFEKFYKSNKSYIRNIIDYDEKEKFFKRQNKIN